MQIITPYDRSETTYAALCLAELASVSGDTVTVYTSTCRKQPVYPAWDRKILSTYRQQANPENVSVVFGFTTMDIMTTTTAALKIGVADNYYGPLPSDGFLKGLDRVITPSVDGFSRLVENTSIKHLMSTTWGTPPVATHVSRRVSNVLSVYLDRSCFFEDHDAIVLLLSLLNNTDAEISVLCGNRLPTRHRRRLHKLWGQYSNRVRYKEVLIGELDMHLLGSRLLIYPGTRSSYGFPAIMATKAGVPFVAYNYGVFADILENASVGYSVNCGVHRARVRYADMAEFCSVARKAAAGNTRYATNLQSYHNALWSSFDAAMSCLF